MILRQVRVPARQANRRVQRAKLRWGNNHNFCKDFPSLVEAFAKLLEDSPIIPPPVVVVKSPNCGSRKLPISLTLRLKIHLLITPNRPHLEGATCPRGRWRGLLQGGGPCRLVRAGRPGQEEEEGQRDELDQPGLGSEESLLPNGRFEPGPSGLESDQGAHTEVQRGPAERGAQRAGEGAGGGGGGGVRGGRTPTPPSTSAENPGWCWRRSHLAGHVTAGEERRPGQDEGDLAVNSTIIQDQLGGVRE